MNTFTPTINADAIPTIVAQETLKYLPAYMGIAQFVSKDVDWTGQDFATYGDTLDILGLGDVEVKTKVPGTPITYQNPSPDKRQVTLDQHKYVAFAQEDITKILQKPQLLERYAVKAAAKLAENLETYILALHPNVTAGTVTFDATSETTIHNSMLELRERFVKLNIPRSEEKILFAAPELVTEILKVDKYTSGDFITGNVIEMGAATKILNTGIFETQLVQKSGSPATWHNLAMTKWGIVLTNRPMPLDGNGRGVMQTNIQDPNTGLTIRLTEGYDKDNMAVTWTIDWLYGAAIADENQILEVEYA